MPKNPNVKRVMVIGSGPIVIGQAAEFDYAGTQACRSLKEEGVEVILVNSNPATIMTDKDIADKVYIEPLNVKVLEQIIEKEKPDSILPTLGGQAGLNLGMELEESGFLAAHNVKLLGTTAATIRNAEGRQEEAMLMTQCRQMLDDFSRRMQSQGLSMDQYFQFTGMTADKMMEDMKPQALKRIQTRLVLEKVAEVENIQPTEEEVNEEISKMAEAYKMEADKLKELLGERELEQMKKDMAVQKAVTVIADAAKEV